MKQDAMDFQAIPETPGVYIFRGARNAMLYVGRATDLRGRVRSYFSDRLLADRGARLTEALEKAERIETVPTDSVLEAYILEAHLIKTHTPMYNVADKDDKSFQYVCITEEDFPRVLTVRGRNIERGMPGITCRYMFGPFPRGGMLKDALRIVRKALPYRDTCTPYRGDRMKPDGTDTAARGGTKSAGRPAGGSGRAADTGTPPRTGTGSARRNGTPPRPCFRAELGLCPGVCTGLTDRKEYARRIREIVLLFSGRKKQLIRNLERTMKEHAKKQEFEKAEEVRRRIFALTHIQDIALFKKDITETYTGIGGTAGAFRIEAYDIAHLAGTDTVGVMAVLTDGEPDTAAYRTFTVRDAVPGDDIGALREILRRRISHAEWRFPNLIVADGGKAHIAAAEKILREHGMRIPVVSVVKDDRHMPRAVLGAGEYAREREESIIRANAEAHRFALARHRRKRTKTLLR